MLDLHQYYIDTHTGHNVWRATVKEIKQWIKDHPGEKVIRTNIESISVER